MYNYNKTVTLLKNIQAVDRFKSLVQISYKVSVNGNFNDEPKIAKIVKLKCRENNV